MDYMDESRILKVGDDATKKMIALWHNLTHKHFAYDVEVVIVNRKDHPKYASIEARELNTSDLLVLVDGRVALALVLEVPTTGDRELIIITHELGHWVLFLQDFIALYNTAGHHSEIVPHLASLAHHPPLYRLQRSVGHEPEQVIRKRLSDTIGAIVNQSEDQLNSTGQICYSLLLADDLLNLDESTCQTTFASLDQCGRIIERTKKILSIAELLDLDNPKSNLVFSRQAVQMLQLGDDWEQSNNIDVLHGMIQKQASQP